MRKSNRFIAICTICGSEAAIGSLCDMHYAARNELFSVKDFELPVCDNCGSAFYQRWLKHPVEDTVKRIIMLGMKSHGKLSDVNISLNKVGKDFVASVEAEGTIPPSKIQKKEKKEITARIRTVKCQSCIKLLGKYHEAVIQVRGDRAGELTEFTENASLGLPMTAERLKYGWNVYFVHKGDANKVVNGIQRALIEAQKQPLAVIRSHKVVGKKDGRMLMRDFYAIR